MRTAALFAIMVLSASCAKDGESTQPVESGTKSLSQRLNESNGYTVDAEGNWVPRNNKRSSFESQGESPYFKGENSEGNKAYKTGDYAKKTWWGNKDYGHQTYQGNTDGSRFRESSRLDGQSAREAGTTARGSDQNYQTGGYQTGAAREAASSGIAKPSDTETDIRRRVYQQPEIIDWREQRTMSVEQSRGILGR